MSLFTSLIIVILAMVIQGFLELNPGLFSIFYHHALGKTSIKKADDQSLSFIIGTEICTALIFLSIYIIINFLIAKNILPNAVFMWTMSCIFLVEAIISFFCYYRSKGLKASQKRQSTMLFIPRHLAANLLYHAEHAKNRSSTIILGFIAPLLELFFTLPLYIIMSVCIFYITPTSNFIFIILYIIVATVPLFTIRTFFRTGHNLAEIEYSRIKKKFPTRIVLTSSYFIIALITFTIGLSI